MMFKTSNYSSLAEPQNTAQPFQPLAPLNTNQTVAPNPTDFNTMQMMFKTSNYSSLAQPQPASQPLNFSQPVSQPQNTLLGAQPVKPNPLDMFSSSKPASFNTMSGVANNGTNFDMNSFGTMQFNPKGSDIDFDFLKSNAPSVPKKQENDLI